MPYGVPFGQLVERKRCEAGLTPERLALKALGSVSQVDVVRNLEAGRIRAPKQPIVAALSAALSISQREISACRSAAEAARGLGGPPRLMEVIAQTFDSARPSASQIERHGLLASKAKEYRAIRGSLIKMSLEGDRRRLLANTVRSHLDSGDLTAAETFLERAERLRQNESFRASVVRLRAAIALLACRPDRAAIMFEEAAARVEQYSHENATELRYGAGRSLYQHALDFGSGRDLPAAFFRQVLEFWTRGEDAEKWAKANNNLAMAVHGHATRATRQAAAALLPEAIDRYRDALTVFKKNYKPLRWASTLCNLAEALGDQAHLVPPKDAAKLLEEAAERLRTALTVRMRGAQPMEFVTTQHDLACILERHAKLYGADGADLLAEAAEANREALTVLSMEKTPHHWAAVQNHYANMLRSESLI
ncbi:MAG: hypothetical protein AAF360_13865 [Pseudomonadota bacterium]